MSRCLSWGTLVLLCVVGCSEKDSRSSADDEGAPAGPSRPGADAAADGEDELDEAGIGDGSFLDGAAAATDGAPPVDGQPNPTEDAGDEAAVPDCPPVAASGEHPVIDDFEGGDPFIPSVEGRGGMWFAYDDGSAGEQQLQILDDGDNWVLYASSSGFTQWGSGFGVTLSQYSSATLQCAYDASAYGGFSFRARGEGRVRFRIGTPASTPVTDGGSCTKPGDGCFDWPGKWFVLGAEWQTFTLPYCALVAEGWSGDPFDLDPAQFGALHFMLDGSSDVQLWLDDLQFIERPEQEPTTCDALCPLELIPPTAVVDPSFSYLQLSEELTVNTFTQESENCGPLTRRYLSYVPTDLAPQSDAPILIALHGSGANAESMQDVMAKGRMDELAQRDGFIVVYGNAAPGAYTDPIPEFTNTGAWRQEYFDDGQVDDVEYLFLVLDDLQSRGVISGDNPVYLTGTSNGGGMVLLAAKEAPERFAGIAPFMAFDGFEPTPVPDLSGTGLSKVLFGYAPGDPGMPEGYTDVLSQLPEQWGAALGMSAEQLENPAEQLLPDVVVEGEDYDGESEAALNTRDSRVRQLDYVTDEAQLRVLVFENAGHFWPHPAGESEAWMIERWGFRNQDLDASDALWDFFTAP